MKKTLPILFLLLFLIQAGLHLLPMPLSEINLNSLTFPPSVPSEVLYQDPIDRKKFTIEHGSVVIPITCFEISGGEAHLHVPCGELVISPSLIPA